MDIVTKYASFNNQANQIKFRYTRKLTDQVLQSFDTAVNLSEEVSKIVEELQDSTKAQTSSIGEMTQTAQSITNAIQQIGANTQKAMERVSQADSVAKETSREAEKGIQGMTSINEVVAKSSESVKNLAGDLQKSIKWLKS